MDATATLRTTDDTRATAAAAKPTREQARLRQACEEVESTGYALRSALISHDTDSIWSALALQEQVALKLEEAQQRLHARRPTTGKVAPPPEVAPRVRELVTRTQLIQRINRTLTRVFLRIVDGAFATLARGQNALSGPLTYGARGHYASTGAPVFVQQLG